MGKLGDYLASQCGNPRGVIGKIMTWAMNRANNVMYKGIIEEINISPKTKILDVGFGNGYLEKLIIRKSPCSITGIDISEESDSWLFFSISSEIPSKTVPLMWSQR